MKEEMVIISGKRKSSVARVIIRHGKGNVVYNGLPYEELMLFHKLALSEPVKISENVLGGFNFDIEITTKGGGKEGQIQAARIGIAKALVKLTKNQDLKNALLDYDRHLIVADTRRKEACKPGDSKARAMRQSSKR